MNFRLHLIIFKSNCDYVSSPCFCSARKDRETAILSELNAINGYGFNWIILQSNASVPDGNGNRVRVQQYPSGHTSLKMEKESGQRTAATSRWIKYSTLLFVTILTSEFVSLKKVRTRWSLWLTGYTAMDCREPFPQKLCDRDSLSRTNHPSLTIKCAYVPFRKQSNSSTQFQYTMSLRHLTLKTQRWRRAIQTTRIG